MHQDHHNQNLFQFQVYYEDFDPRSFKRAYGFSGDFN